MESFEAYVLTALRERSEYFPPSFGFHFCMSEVNAASPKGNQSRIFLGRTDAEAEAPVLWLPDVKS